VRASTDFAEAGGDNLAMQDTRETLEMLWGGAGGFDNTRFDLADSEIKANWVFSPQKKHMRLFGWR
jgi:hypothetical protein